MPICVRPDLRPNLVCRAFPGSRSLATEGPQTYGRCTHELRQQVNKRTGIPSM